MRRKVVSVILAIALVGLILPGCVPKTDLTECQSVVSEQESQVAELASQVTTLNTTIKANDAEIAKLLAQISELETQIITLNSTLEAKSTAKIEVTYSPNPVVPYENEYWRWTMVLTEVNGVGVKLKSVIRQTYDKKGEVYIRSYGGVAWFNRWIEDSYLSACGSASFETAFSYQSEVDYVVFVVIGTDDNGHRVEDRGRVDFEF